MMSVNDEINDGLQTNYYYFYPNIYIAGAIPGGTTLGEIYRQECTHQSTKIVRVYIYIVYSVELMQVIERTHLYTTY